MDTRNLRAAADAADAERFVGREQQLRAAEELLDPATPSRILYVHGPGGIGKSALLREIGRRAQQRGVRVLRLDGRTSLVEAERSLGEALAEAEPPGLILLDEADALGSALAALRDRIVAAVPDTARVVVAARARPEPSWREAGLDAILAELALPPLSDAEASALLAARGVRDEHVHDILAWAQGSPLALTVASAQPGAAPVSAGDLEVRLTAWLTGRATLDIPQDVLEVAALAPAVDARLLAAALPGRPTRDAMARLLDHPVVERVGDRAVLHAVLAAAVRDRLHRTAPERVRTLTRRIAEHLGARARLGDVEALVELSRFIDGPELRLAVSNRPSATHYADGARRGELAEFARAHGFDAGEDWAELARWAAVPGRYTVVVRRAGGDPILYSVFSAVADVGTDGPVAESLTGAAQALELDARRAFAGFVLLADAPLQDRAEASRLGSGALMTQHGMPDMHAVLLHFPDPDRRPVDAIAPVTRDLPHLPRSIALSDFRPIGAAGFVEAIVLRELGVEPRSHDPLALLAAPDSPERTAALGRLLDEVFDDGTRDRLLRRVLELAHLEPRRSEAELLSILHVSRRTWFRLLREARERVAVHRG